MAEMEPALAAAAEANPDYSVLPAMLTFCRWQAGRRNEAAELLQMASADGFVGLSYDLFWAYTLVFYAEVAAALGTTESAAVLYGLLRPWSDQVVTVTAAQMGSIALYHGDAGRQPR